ncbi:uncharacterized protein LOC131685614 [Topomyia yanbarensis]|uniref:uncharacterized protein LOC131685614 n=1 Tax=Topomyia yanbarensis TaxID=2498891 RepID=UPI00273B35B8|nr:uncharacterized protein LOC131685614 [Topomyia yanbarensis]
MRRLLPVAFIVFGVISGVQCGFGLNVTVSSFTKSITSSIGNGINLVVKANASIKIAADDDNSGTIRALIAVSNNVTTPLNRLLGSILAAATAENVNSDELFVNIFSLVAETRPALDAASNAASDLQKTTKEYLYQTLSGNLTELSTILTNLTDGLDYLHLQVYQAANEEYPVTSKNITIFINSTVIADITMPLEAIQNYLTHVASVITVIASERTQVIKYLTQMNETISNGLRNIQNSASGFNRTVIDAYHRIMAQQVNTFKNINQTYAAIVSRASSYNGGDISNLTMFLSDLVAANASFLQFVSLSTNYTMEQINPVLQDRIAAATKTLTRVARFIANQSAINISQHANQCAQRFMQKLQQNPVVITRLSRCIQQDSNALQPTVTFVQYQMDLVRSAASSIANQMSKVCQRNTGACARAYFAALPDHSQVIQNKISVIAGVVSNDEHVVTGRIINCLYGTGADIIENALLMTKKFNRCMLVGP